MKKFNLCNQEFIISDDFEKYNEYRKIFNEVAKASLDEFDKIYRLQIKDLDMLINKIPQLAKKMIVDSVSAGAIRLLVTNGIMNMNEELFIGKYYYSCFNFDKYFDPILDKYVKITEASEKLESYRKMEKATRSKWQGGGIGIKGAIKGSVTAGVLNLGTDVLRSFADSNTANKDKNEINLLKKSVYEDSNTYDLLRNGIYNCVFGVFYGLINELIENEAMSEIIIDQKQSQVIFENTLKYEENPQNILNNIAKCIKMNPYNIEFYKVIADLDRENTEIFDIARFFGFKNQINKIINQRNRKIEKENAKLLRLKTYFTEEEINNSKYDLEKESEFIGKYCKKPSSEDIKRNGNKLAQEYVYGKNEYPEDLKRAFYWYKRSAELGNKVAERNLAVCYLDGRGTEKNYEKAINIMEKICSEDNNSSDLLNNNKESESIEKVIGILENATQGTEKDLHNELGKCYFKGLGIGQDYERAYYWFNKSESLESQYYLGLMYEEGKGVEKNLEKAKEHFINATEHYYGEIRELSKERLKKYENVGDKETKAKIKSILEKGHDFKEQKEKPSMSKRILKVIVILAITGFLQDKFPAATDILSIITFILMVAVLMGY